MQSKCDDCIIGYESGMFALAKRFINASEDATRDYFNDPYNRYKYCPECGYQVIAIEEQESISLWFSLSYSSYLVLPRLLLEAMPPAWQHQFVTMLQEIEETIELDPDYTSQYMINYRKNKRYAVDPYRDYRRGTVKLKERIT